MQYGLGIDLGTTQTAAAIRTDGRIEVVRLGSRRAEIPSVVFVRPDGGLLLGEPAERRGHAEPGRLAREFKRRIGDPVPILVGGVPFSAHALTAKLLREVLDTVTRLQGGPPAVLTVTHPANWGPYKRELLGQALKLADTGPALLRTEPEAAALQHATARRIADGETVVVYDLGGGTFDAAVLRRDGTGFRLLGDPEGIEQLGGADFDEAVFGHVLRSLGSRIETLDPNEPEVVTALARLRRDCVEAKESLSFDTEVMIPVALPGVHTRVRLNRSELESMIAPALQDTVAALHRALRSAGVAPEELDAVLLAGGSSRIPLVSQLLSGAFERPVVADPHPEHSIAMGAAVSTATITGGVSPFAAAVPPAPKPAAEATPKPAAKAAPEPAATADIAPRSPAAARQAPTVQAAAPQAPAPRAAQPHATAAAAALPAATDAEDQAGGGEPDRAVVSAATDPWATSDTGTPAHDGGAADPWAATDTGTPPDGDGATEFSAEPGGWASHTAPESPQATSWSPQPTSPSGRTAPSPPVAYSRGAASIPGTAPAALPPVPQTEVLPPPSSPAPRVGGTQVFAGQGSPPPPDGPPRKRNGGLLVLVGVLTLAVIAGAATAVVLTLRDRDKDQPTGAQAPLSPSVSAPLFPTDKMLIRVDTGGGLPPERKSGVYLITPGQTGRQKIADTGVDVLPAWSHDRKRIALTRYRSDGTGSIWVMDADGSHAEQVVEEATDGRATWSGNDKQLAFMREVDGTPQIFVIDLGTANVRQLTEGPGQKDDPAWSPGGRAMAYWAVDGDERQLFIIGLTDPDEPGRQLTKGDSGPGVDPVWSPDGSKIAYTHATGDDTSDIWVVGPDGKGARQLTEHEDREMDPSWSPDGKWVAFTRGPLEEPKVVVVKDDGSGEQTLTTGDAREGHPCWF